MAATYSITLLTLIRMQAGWQIRYTRIGRDIKDFLIKNRIDTNVRLAILIRIAKYLSRKLSLPEGTLIKKIYT
ncbi:unnamed protein product [Fusarium fujikuroi]|nr:unnamed protein product [Fusarium fujikuroi]